MKLCVKCNDIINTFHELCNECYKELNGEERDDNMDERSEKK